MRKYLEIDSLANNEENNTKLYDILTHLIPWSMKTFNPKKIRDEDIDRALGDEVDIQS